MMMLKLLEGLALVTLVVLLLTEVILPFAKGTRYFPTFRRRGPVDHAVRQAEDAAVDLTELGEAQDRLHSARARVDDLGAAHYGTRAFTPGGAPGENGGDVRFHDDAAPAPAPPPPTPTTKVAKAPKPRPRK